MKVERIEQGNQNDIIQSRSRGDQLILGSSYNSSFDSCINVQLTDLTFPLMSQEDYSGIYFKKLQKYLHSVGLIEKDLVFNGKKGGGRGAGKI